MGAILLPLLRRSWPYLLPLALGLAGGWWLHARTHPMPAPCPVAAVCPACPSVPEVKCDTGPSHAECKPKLQIVWKQYDAGCPVPDVTLEVPVEASSGPASASAGPPPDSGTPEAPKPLLCPPPPPCRRSWLSPGLEADTGGGSVDIQVRLGDWWLGPVVRYQDQRVQWGAGVRYEIP